MKAKGIDLSGLKIGALLNKSSGSCDEACEKRITEILERSKITARIEAVYGKDVDGALNRMMSDKIDALIVLGGDGTIRAAAELCSQIETKLIPLPGGTMNMLPKALYGEIDWDQLLDRILAAPQLADVGGGEVDGHRFFCAGLFGSPALWAEAREAARENNWVAALSAARRAYHKAFSRKLRYRAAKGPEHRATALSVICPLISAVTPSDAGFFEVAVLDPNDLGDAFQLAWTAVFSGWRKDANVSSVKTDCVAVRAAGHIPALLDGEKVLLPAVAEIRFNERCFTAIVPAVCPRSI